jgi:hypothetical protein
MAEPVGRLRAVVDAADLPELAEFWHAVIEARPDEHHHGPKGAPG